MEGKNNGRGHTWMGEKVKEGLCARAVARTLYKGRIS